MQMSYNTKNLIKNSKNTKKELNKNFLFLFLTILITINSIFLTPINCTKNLLTKKLLSEQNINFNELNNLLSLHSQVIGSSKGSLSILAGANQEAKIKLGCPNNFLTFTLREKSKDFVLMVNQRPIFITSYENDMMMFNNFLKPNKGLDFTGVYKVRNIPQWRLVHEEDFSNPSNIIGWSKNDVTECGGVKMLGGYCKFGAGEVLKTYGNLPKHSMIKIEATYHFIDAWTGEAGFMRVDNGKNGAMQYIWIENYSAYTGGHGVNVCGGRWPEGKFASPINVNIPHTKDSVKIGFGATTEQDSCLESFGVSGIRIYVK